MIFSVAFAAATKKIKRRGA